MRRRILTATAALILVLSFSATLAAPAAASAFDFSKRPSLDLQDLLSWATSWFSGLWEASEEDEGTPDPTPIPGDDDERGPNLDPDG